MSWCGPRDVARLSRGSREEGAQTDHVVCRRGEGHDPIDAFTAAMPELAQPADRLHPAKDLLDQFPLSLADGIAGRTRRSIIDGAARDLLRDVRRHPERAHA